MSVHIRQEIGVTVAQQQTLTVQQQQSLKLLQYSAQELELELKKMLQENPMLELDTGSSDEDYSSNYASDEEDYYSPEIPASISLQEYLLEQLSTSVADDLQKVIISYLIGDIDDNGYLTTQLDELDALLSETLGREVPIQACEQALAILQSFEPAGVGARDLAECLLLQLDSKRLPNPVDDEVLTVARTICAQGLEALAHADIVHLENLTHTDIEHIRLAHLLIKQLDPRPGRQFSAQEADYAIPDVLCYLEKGRWTLKLNPQILPRLRIHADYERLVKVMDKKELAESVELMDQLKQARLFMSQLNQRFATLLMVAQSIMQEQYAFFEKGLAAIKPLTLKMIAEQLSLHESTISRAVNQKFIATPHGIFELKRFFSSGVGTQDGDNASATAIQQKLQALVATEPKHKPLSDSKLAELLEQEGIVIARRTVAKYREAVGIPTASIRKAQALLAE